MPNTNKQAGNKPMTPEEELRDLCDFSVVDCVAKISKLAVGTEYHVGADFDTLIESLKKVPDLKGVFFDGVTSVHRPGILRDDVVFYNRTEEQLLKHLEEVERHDQVHWMFKQLMIFQEECLRRFREALPDKEIKYGIDSAELHAMTERMLRVIVQSGKVKTQKSIKALEDRKAELRKLLNGSGKLKESDLQEKLRRLEIKRKKQKAEGATKRLAATDKEIAATNADIELITKREKLQIQQKAYQDAKDEKRLEETKNNLRAVQIEIAIKEGGLQDALTTMTAEREMLSGKVGKQAERDALDVDIKSYKEKIRAINDQIETIIVRMEELEGEQSNYREPETSPIYQRRVDDHVKDLYKRFKDMGDRYNIDIITQPCLVVFGTMVIDWSPDRGRTWAPNPKRAKRLAQSYHPIIEDYRAHVTETLAEMGAPTQDVDVVNESGHHGLFMARWQRLYLTPEEVRMQHVNTFYTGGSDGVKHMLYLVDMPFEDQEKISEYSNRGKPSRTRAGKMMNTSNHPTFVRNDLKSVSGVQILRKHKHGFMSVEVIEYRLYKNKEVLKPFKAVMSQDDSDNHFASKEWDPAGTLGTLVMNDQLMERPFELYEQKVYLSAKFNVGDMVEPGSGQWPEPFEFRRQVMKDVKDILKTLVDTDYTDYKSVQQMFVRYLNDMMGGSNENMVSNARIGGWYLKKQFLNVRKSPTRCRDALAAIEGNHFGDASRKKRGSFKELTPFEEWLLALISRHEDFPELGLKPASLKVMAGGEPQYFQKDVAEHETVIHLGGYSVSRQAVIPQFGIGSDGKLVVQKTYTVGMTHEPNAFEMKAINQRADVIKGGHIHEETLILVRAGKNHVRILDQKGCTTRVTATELSYGGVPRTAGVSLCIYSQPGRYFKLFIPMEHMRKICMAWFKIEVIKAIENKKKLLATQSKK